MEDGASDVTLPKRSRPSRSSQEIVEAALRSALTKRKHAEEPVIRELKPCTSQGSSGTTQALSAVLKSRLSKAQSSSSSKTVAEAPCTIQSAFLKFQSVPMSKARHDQDCLISDAISVVPRQSTVLAELAEDRPIAGRQTVESALQPTSLNGKRTGIYTYLNFCAHWCFHPNILESLNLSDQEDYDSVSRLYGYSYSIVRRCGTRTECYVTTLFQQLN